MQAAFLAGYKPGGAFNNTLGSLRSAGLIEYPSAGDIALTDEGRAHAREADVPLTTEALQHAVMNRLSGPQRRVLRPVIAAWPDELSVEERAGAPSTTRAAACGPWASSTILRPGGSWRGRSCS